MLVGFLDRRDVDRWVAFEAHQDLAGLLRHQRLGGLLFEKIDRNPIGSANHQRVVRVPNNAGQLVFNDLVEQVVGDVEVEDVRSSPVRMVGRPARAGKRTQFE